MKSLLHFVFFLLFHNVYYIQGINYNNSTYFIVTNQSFITVLYRNFSPILSFQGIGYLYEYNNSLIVVGDNGSSLIVYISYNGINFHEESLISHGFIEGTPLFSSGFLAVLNNGYLQVFNIYNGKIILNKSFLGEPIAFYYPYLISGYIENGIHAYEYDIISNTTTYLGTVEGIDFSPNGTLIEINNSEILVGKEIIPLNVEGENYIQEGYYNNSLYLLVSSIYQNKTEIELIKINNGKVEYSSEIRGIYIPTSIIFENGKPYGIFIDVNSNDAYEIPLYSTTNSQPYVLFIIAIILVIIGIIFLVKKLKS